MDDKKKKFAIPEAEIVNFAEEDIITKSAGLGNWDEDDNTEVWG